MLRILNEEDGFEIKERELMRVRAKNRWLLRVPNGMKPRKRDSELDVMDQLQDALFEEGQQGDTERTENAGKAARYVVSLFIEDNLLEHGSLSIFVRGVVSGLVD
jgi:hypothetical protein